MLPLTADSNTCQEIVPASTEPLKDKEELAVVESPDNQLGMVTAGDINKAANYGVMAGFQRHMECEPKVKAKAALDIMEALYPTFDSKIWMFICMQDYGSKLINELEDPVLKAEFAIRVARMMNDRKEQATWTKTAMVLLQDETTRDQCPKTALETLGRIWAEVGNHEQTIHWFAAAQSKRTKYLEVVNIFFSGGAFDNGLAIYDQAPPKEDLQEKDTFIDLIACGLRDKGLYEMSEYRMSVLSHQNDGYNREIILRALCHLSLKELALTLSKEMSLQCDRIYYMLTVSPYITEASEREAYIDALCETALQIDDKNEKTSGYGEMQELVKSGNITTYEAITLSYWVQKPAPSVSALFNRACGITNKKEKVVEELRELQAILRTIVTHLTMTSELASDYWQKVLEKLIEYDFLEDAKAVEKPWREWRKSRGKSEYESLYLSDEVRVLCIFALLKYMDGNTQDAIADLMEGATISKALCDENPNRRDSLNDGIYYSVQDLKRSPLEFTSMQSTVCRALAHNPRSCELIFKLEKGINVIFPLSQTCVNVLNNIDKITQLTRQSLVKRSIENLQYKILTAKITHQLNNVGFAVIDAIEALYVYRECFQDQESVALANGLEHILQSMQGDWIGYWTMRKIRKYILPLEREFIILFQKLAGQLDLLKTELNNLTRK